MSEVTVAACIVDEWQRQLSLDLIDEITLARRKHKAIQVVLYVDGRGQVAEPKMTTSKGK